jgi:hypothetical protein
VLLTQDFDRDFDTLTAGLLPDYSGPPYAFTRYADGEVGIMIGRRHKARSDGWKYRGRPTPLSGLLLYALACDLPGWCVGISCPCHEPDDWRWCMERATVPLPRRTFASIFCYANFGRFNRLDLSRVALVANAGTELLVPSNAVFPLWEGYRDLVDRLLTIERPIVVAAGPLANVIIHEYWRRATNPQVIVDIGSALDPRLRGRRSRKYQRKRHPAHGRRCEWIPSSI